MEDGAPIYRAQVAKAWREKQLLETFKWPAQSPDLNFIANVWFLLKHAVHVRRIRPRTPTDMITALNEEWKNISKGYLDELINVTPERMNAVIKNKVALHGGNTLSLSHSIKRKYSYFLVAKLLEPCCTAI